MSQVVRASKFEQVKLPNPSITHKKWNFDDADAKSLKRDAESLGYLALVVAGLFALRPILAATNEFVVFAAIVLVPIAAFFFFPKIGNRLVARKEQKRDAYRRENAPLILNLLHEQGWKVWNKDALETIVADNNPYLINPEGVRYYAKYFDIRDNHISFSLTLSDEAVEGNIRKTEKQKTIESKVRLYELRHGPMTAEKKEGFVAALEMSL